MSKLKEIQAAKLNTAVKDAIKTQANQAAHSGTSQACCVMPDELNPSAYLFTTFEPFIPAPKVKDAIAKQAALPNNPRLESLQQFGIRTMLDAALRYAYHGLKVFPLVAGGKVPRGGTNGFRDGTTDPLRIIEWWTENPKCNIGIVTGATEQATYECSPDEQPSFMQRPHKPYHLLVLDVDVKDGKDGGAVINALAEQHGALPPTVMQNTPTGGAHMLFKVPVDAGLKSPTNIFKEHGEGLDTRCTNGYIVAAPSVTVAGDKTVDGMYCMGVPCDAGYGLVYDDAGEITESPGLLHFFRTTDEIAELPAAWVAALQSVEKRSSTGIGLGKAKTNTTAAADGETLSVQELAELELACEYINLDDRANWVAAMLGLMPYGEVGLQLWIKASRKGKYANESSAVYELKWEVESDTNSNSDKGIVHSIVNRQLNEVGNEVKQAAYKAAMQAIKNAHKKPEPWTGGALNLPTVDIGIGIGTGAQTDKPAYPREAYTGKRGAGQRTLYEAVKSSLSDAWVYDNIGETPYRKRGNVWETHDKIITELERYIQTYAESEMWVFSNSTVENARKLLLRSMPPASWTPTKTDTRTLIPMRNGVVEVTATQATLRAYRDTEQFNHQLPYEYAPHANAPEFMAHIHKAFGGEQGHIDVLQAFFHLIAVSGYEVQKILHLVGVGGSGKSVLMGVAGALVGDANTLSVTLKSLEEQRFTRANAYGKKLIIMPDVTVPKSAHASYESLKAITGHDLVDGERKNIQIPMQFRYEGMVMITSNNTISTNDDGMNRRLVSLRMDNKIPTHEITATEQRLGMGIEQYITTNEMAGVMNWALSVSTAQAKETLRNPPHAVGKAQEKRQLEADNYLRWIRERLVQCHTGQGLESPMGKAGTGFTPESSPTLYVDFTQWCAEEGLDKMNTSVMGLQKEMEERLKRLGIKPEYIAVREDNARSVTGADGSKKDNPLRQKAYFKGLRVRTDKDDASLQVTTPPA